MASRQELVCPQGAELRVGEFPFDCNIPELLARDLERSKDIFISKDMTAGCPCAGLAAPNVIAGPPVQGPPDPYSNTLSGCDEQAMDFMRPQKHWIDDEDEKLCFKQPGGNRDERPGSISAELCKGKRRPSIRTRQQSVVTEATSISARCSSLFSHGAHLPSSPVLSPCSSNREGSFHGTRFDDEPDSPQDGLGSSVFTARTSVSDQQDPVLERSSNGDKMEHSKSAADEIIEPKRATTHAPWGSSNNHCSRPHTPANQAHREKPRIVDIPPPTMAEDRVLQSSPGRCGPEYMPAKVVPWDAMPPPTASVGMIRLQKQPSRASSLREELRSGASLLETANGRTVIDASTPPSIPLARQRQYHPSHSNLAPPETIDESECSDDEDSRPTVRAGRVTLARDPALAGLRRWADASPDTPASPHCPAPYPPSAPSPSFPLPPVVIESLRVSISCFPETMLLTSSLSIETIRAYSKKVKHRATRDRGLWGADTDSACSSRSQDARPSKRWNMGSWLGHSRRGSKQHPQPQPQVHEPPLPGGLGSSTEASTPRPSAGPQPPSTNPPWAPITNIFPSAPPRLCDALYAHLLAYNYLTSLSTSALFTPTLPAPPGTARAKTSYGQHHHPSQSSSSTTTAAGARGAGAADAFPPPPTCPPLRVPSKAASLLGMDDPVSAAAAYQSQYQQQQQQQHHHHHHHRHRQAPRTRRGLLGGSRRPTNSTHPLHDLFTGIKPSSSSAAAAAGGGFVAFPRSGTSHGGGGGGFGPGCGSRFGFGCGAVPGGWPQSQLQPQPQPGMSELRAGLKRCIGMLVAAMRREVVVGGLAEEEAGLATLLGGGEDGGWVVEVEPVLMRALCEAVRCAEDRGGWAF